MTKKCTKCGLVKPISCFYKNKANKSGVDSGCKLCKKEYAKNNKERIALRMKVYSLENVELKKEYNQEYYKNNCEKIKKQNSQYYFDNLKSVKKQREKFHNENKHVRKERDLVYYYQNKNKINARCRRYYRENIDKIKAQNRTERGKLMSNIRNSKRRALKKKTGGYFTEQQMKECLEFFKNKCAYSGNDLDNKVLHIDHIKAISKGGTNYIWNLCPSIASANLSKYNSDMEDWYRKQEYFTEERLAKIYEWQEYAYKKYSDKQCQG